MIGVFFDTLALVPVVTEQLVKHAAAHARFVAEIKGGRAVCCSTLTLRLSKLESGCCCLLGSNLNLM